MIHRRVQAWLCASLCLLGLSVVIGWLAGIEGLKSILPDLSTMKFNAALAFIFTGAGLFSSARGRSWRAVACGVALLLIGGATLAQYLFHVDLGIDELVVRDEGILTGSGVPGRMSPLTACAWLALGSSIILLSLGRTRSAVAAGHIIASLAGFIAFLAVAGYAFGAQAFWGIGFYTAVAVHTAVGLMVAVAAALLTRPFDGWLSGLTDAPTARRLLVRLLPLALGLPMALGLLLAFGSGAGAYNSAFAFAFFVPAMTVALTLLALSLSNQIRREEHALRESEEHLETALASARLGTFEWDLATDNVQLDQRARLLFGFKADEPIVARQIFARIHSEDLPRVTSEVARARSECTRLETEYRVVVPGQGDRFIASLSDAALGPNGRPARMVGVFGDVSERKRLEHDLQQLNETLEERVRDRTAELNRVHEQLRESQKLEAMGQLTGGVAHDFNNLLTPIIGSLDMLQRRGLRDDRERRLVLGALEAAERAKTLVQRLLAFARRQPLQPAPVHVASVIEDMKDLIGSTSGPNIKLQIDIDDNLPPAWADRNQLEMAILNLSVNARDAMPNGGTLTIATRREEVGADNPWHLRAGAYVKICVSDTGIGMDEQTLARAFEPFFSTKGLGQGTGLGLSMVHGLASQLGGAVTIASKPGLGTTVDLLLPQSNAEPVAERAPSSGDAEAASGRIVLVDDEPGVRASTAEMLIDLGYDVVEFDRATEALEWLDDNRADLVVTDHLMPGMSGTDLARRLTAERPELRTLIVSGYADLECISPDLPRLSKPFRMAELAEALVSLQK